MAKRNCLSGTTFYRGLASRGPAIGVAIAAFLLAVCEYKVASSQASDSLAASSIHCVPDRPIVYPGEKINVSLWLGESFRETLIGLEWKSSVGKIRKSDQDTVAIWSFSEDGQGVSEETPATATVTVNHRTMGEFACEVEVYFVDPPLVVRGGRGPSLLTARSFLLPDQTEPEGYGLYSYFLLAAPPRNAQERERYLKGLESYLLLVQPVERLERYKNPSQLNITLLPIRNDIKLGPDITEERASELAEELLKVYDYARAQALLADFGIPLYLSGPILIAKTPPTKKAEAMQLELDMSYVVPKLVWEWTRAFCLLATQPSSPTEINLRKLALNVRNVIAISAGHLPNVLDKLDDWIKVLNAKA